MRILIIPECSAPREYEIDHLKTNNAGDWSACIAHRTLHNKALKHVVQQTAMKTADCTVLLSTEHGHLREQYILPTNTFKVNLTFLYRSVYQNRGQLLPMISILMTDFDIKIKFDNDGIKTSERYLTLITLSFNLFLDELHF